jgi:hypothetical protein
VKMISGFFFLMAVLVDEWDFVYGELSCSLTKIGTKALSWVPFRSSMPGKFLNVHDI